MTPESTPRRLHPALIAPLALALGIGGTWLAMRPARPHLHEAQASPAPKRMYQCPMHPQILQDHPGDCPICGMALVPVENGAPQEGHGSDTHAVVSIDPERQQLIGLHTERVEEGPLGGEIRASGRVAVDETRVRKVNVKVEGFVERLYVDFVGKPVAKGAPLFSLYSPEFMSAQQEFLLALRTQKALAGGSLQGSGSDLLDSARRRLLLWDVPREAIERLEKTGEVQRALTLRSPISGVVTAKNVVEGARITPSEIPFEITDLSRVWVLVDIYEAELGRTQVGMAAELSSQALPGHRLKGRVAFMDPLMDPKTRTAKLRLEFPNPKGELKPEMFGEVLLKAQNRKGLSIPLDAMLDAGNSKVAFVALGKGKFEPREIQTGTSSGDRVEVVSGLEAGDEVVVRANFLVDSESRLKAALAQMSQKAPAAPSGSHQHEGPR